MGFFLSFRRPGLQSRRHRLGFTVFGLHLRRQRGRLSIASDEVLLFDYHSHQKLAAGWLPGTPRFSATFSAPSRCWALHIGYVWSAVLQPATMICFRSFASTPLVMGCTAGAVAFSQPGPTLVDIGFQSSVEEDLSR